MTNNSNKNQKSLREIINYRLDKINNLNENNIDVYPHKFNKKNHIKDLFSIKNKNFPKVSIQTAGRIMSLRLMGKAAFLNIQDITGKIQIYINKNDISIKLFNLVVKSLDIGDIIGVKGFLFYTKTKELTIKIKKIQILSKNIRPLPNMKEKEGSLFFNFDNKENRYYHRQLDLIVNSKSKDIFIKRSRIISFIRQILDKNDFLEVETPVLQPLYGGANARPFTTFHNSLDRKLYLRIATELYLKRLIVGGYEKVYEISKNFRNEGVDKSHNPEFTMLELYESYADVYDMAKLLEKLFKSLIKEFKIKEVMFNNEKIELNQKFKKETMNNLFKQYLNIDIFNITQKELIQLSKENGLSLKKNSTKGKVVEKLFSHVIEHHLIQPTFVFDYPRSISPLAKGKRNDSSNNIVERFELFIGGIEFANAFSELNDPREQKKRFDEQVKLKEMGDDEANVVDDNFLFALENAMPPTGGMGLGIDRLVMLLTEQTSIKDVILFPISKK